MTGMPHTRHTVHLAVSNLQVKETLKTLGQSRLSRLLQGKCFIESLLGGKWAGTSTWSGHNAHSLSRKDLSLLTSAKPR